MYNSNMPEKNDLPTSKQLLRSTAIAMVAACALLVFTVLPSEYGYDPTGVGGVLGLTKMGEIKVSLDEELEKGITSGTSSLASSQQTDMTPVQKKSADIPQDNQRTDERRFVLQPGEAAEIKLEIKKDSVVLYEWVAIGGTLNHDTHGDPYDANGSSQRHSSGRMVPGDKGQLKAKFSGYHGWFWRNREKSPVNVVLKVNGDYLGIKRVL